MVGPNLAAIVSSDEGITPTFDHRSAASNVICVNAPNDTSRRRETPSLEADGSAADSVSR